MILDLVIHGIKMIVFGSYEMHDHWHWRYSKLYLNVEAKIGELSRACRWHISSDISHLTCRKGRQLRSQAEIENYGSLFK